MARPDRERFSARVEFRARPSHKALWESLLDLDTEEKFSEWMNDAANERARRILESRNPGSSRGIPIRRPSPAPVVAPALPWPTQAATKMPGKKPRRKR